MIHPTTKKKKSSTLLPGLGPLFLYGLGMSCELMGLLTAFDCVWPFGDVAAAAAAASAAAFSIAMVWLFGLLPRTPLRTGRGGRGCGKRYGDCMGRQEWLDWPNAGIRVFGKLTKGEGETKKMKGYLKYYNIIQIK